MRGKSSRVLAFVVSLAFIFIIAAFIPEGCNKGNKTVENESSQPSITTPSTNTKVSTAPREQSTTATQTQQSQANGSMDDNAAIEAAKASAKESNPSIGALDVLASKIVDGWARVDLQPVNMSTDAASWLLKKTNGQWVVVDFGTSVMPSDHPDAPAELFK